MGIFSKDEEPQVSTVQNSNPLSDAALPFIRQLFSGAQSAYEATPRNPFAGQFVAQPTQGERQANAGRMAFANSLGNPAEAFIPQILATGRGDFLRPESNPALQANLNEITRRGQQQFDEVIRPGLTDVALRSGAANNSRRVLNLRDAGETYGRELTGALARPTFQNYQFERQLQANAPQMLTSAVQAGLLPMDIMAAAGASERALDQLPLNEALAQYQNQQQAPWNGIPQYAQVLQGFPVGGSGTQTVTSPGQSNGTPFGNALSGGVGGLALAGSLGEAIPALSFMGGPWGLAAGAGLGMLGGLFG